jgi:hypothetical protein
LGRLVFCGGSGPRSSPGSQLTSKLFNRITLRPWTGQICPGGVCKGSHFFPNTSSAMAAPTSTTVEAPPARSATAAQDPTQKWKYCEEPLEGAISGCGMVSRGVEVGNLFSSSILRPSHGRPEELIASFPSHHVQLDRAASLISSRKNKLHRWTVPSRQGVRGSADSTSRTLPFDAANETSASAVLLCPQPS